MQYNYYRILGINEKASIPEIKRAYRQKAKLFHPDRNDSPKAAEAFHVLQDAYQTLVSPEKRRKYDIRLRFKEPVNPRMAHDTTDPRYRKSPYSSDYRAHEIADEKRFNPHPVLLISLYLSAMFVGAVCITLLVFSYMNDDMPWYVFFSSLPALVLLFEGAIGLIKDANSGVFGFYRRLRNVFIPHWD